MVRPALVRLSIQHFCTANTPNDKTTLQKKDEPVIDKSNHSAKKYGEIALNATKSGVMAVFDFLSHPLDIPRKLGHAWQEVKDVAKHYWVLMNVEQICEI